MKYGEVESYRVESYSRISHSWGTLRPRFDTAEEAIGHIRSIQKPNSFGIIESYRAVSYTFEDAHTVRVDVIYTSNGNWA